MSGWARVDCDVLDRHLASLDGTAWKVYLALQRHANADGACWPSQALIANKTGLQERAVRYAITRLVEADLITIERQSGRPTVYRLTPAPPCRPEDEGAAPECHTPRHDDAGTPAPPCRSPRHRHAAELDTRSSYKNKKGRVCDTEGKIPESLSTDEFKDAWRRWIAYRREIRKPLTASTTAAQLKKLATWGPARAVAAIDYTIEHGWKGIFEAKSAGSAAATTRKPDPEPMRLRDYKVGVPQ
jgi:DNA-binding transcriptional ArsR family regulator